MSGKQNPDSNMKQHLFLVVPYIICCHTWIKEQSPGKKKELSWNLLLFWSHAKQVTPAKTFFSSHLTKNIFFSWNVFLYGTKKDYLGKTLPILTIFPFIKLLKTINWLITTAADLHNSWEVVSWWSQLELVIIFYQGRSETVALL